MKATTNIHTTEVITHSITGFDGNENAAAGAGNIQGTQAGAAGQGQTQGKPESELRAAARRHGLNLKELADRMGVSYGYLSSVASGRRPWTPMLRERATAVLGEIPGQGVVYRQGGLVQGESTCIRERARALGLSQKELAHRVGVSVGYMRRWRGAGRTWARRSRRGSRGRWAVRLRSRPPVAPTGTMAQSKGRAATSGSAPGRWALA